MIKRKTTINRTKIRRDFVVFKKFFNGLNKTKIKPAKLLIKKRGYRKTFSQKLFIKLIYIYIEFKDFI